VEWSQALRKKTKRTREESIEEKPCAFFIPGVVERGGGKMQIVLNDKEKKKGPRGGAHDKKPSRGNVGQFGVR